MCDSIFNAEALVRDSFVLYAESHGEISSTNDRALQLCRDPELETPCLVVAERQTAGRGRRGNSWWSPNGALLFSIVLDAPEQALDQGGRGLMALAAAVGVADAIDELVLNPPPSKGGAKGGIGFDNPLSSDSSPIALNPSPNLSPQGRGITQIKWPNDVLIGPRKVAGILVEAPHLDRAAPRRLVIGIGLNVNNRREDAASLAETAEHAFDLHQTLITVLRRLEHRLDEVSTHQDVLLASLRQRCALTGRDVKVGTGHEEITGRCLGIADDGSLLIAASGEPRRIQSGTVLEISPSLEGRG